MGDILRFLWRLYIFLFRVYEAVRCNILFLWKFIWGGGIFAVENDDIATAEDVREDIRVFRLDPNQQYTTAFTFFHEGLSCKSTEVSLSLIEERVRGNLQNIALWDNIEQSPHPFVRFGEAQEALKLGNFVDEWNSYRWTSRSLFLFFKLLQAPYPVLDHVLDCWNVDS